MPDIFNRQTDVFGGAFAADQAKATFPALAGGGSDTGLLMQNLSFNYSQNVARLFEIGSPAIYYVGGRTSGQAGVQRVIGPRKIAGNFYATYGDVCNARTNTLLFSVEAGCQTDFGFGRASYIAHFVVITTIGVNVGAQDMLINEQLQLMFSSLLYE